MLVNRAPNRLRRRESDDAGVALVAVLVVMLVGFVIVSTIAASVVFTIQANSGNKIRTQAFIAAESGRDQMLAQYLASCKPSISPSTTAPLYKDVSVVSSGPDAAHQSSPATCASTTATTVFVIQSTGVGPDGTTDTIRSTFNRQVTYTNQPGGTTSALYGTFTNTKLSYTGDFVVRGGDYNCTSGGAIDGNLWVLKDPLTGAGGNVNLQTGCEVTGSVYAQGTVTLKGSGMRIDGNLVSAGAGGNVVANAGSIVGGVYADGTVDLGGSSAKSFLAGGKVSGASAANVTQFASSTGGCAPIPSAKCTVNATLTSTPGTAMYIPSPATVWSMTTWVDLNRASFVSTDIQWHTPTTAAACWTDWTSVLTEALAAGKTRVGVDLTGCPTPKNGKVPVTMNPAATQTNDVVFVFPAGTPMDVTVSGALNPLLNPANAATWPQLFFIHSDTVVNNPPRVGPGPDCSASIANDSFTLPDTAQARVMVYTPCGLDPSSLNGNGKYSMTGQFYSNAADGNNTAQPEVDCQLMAWSPILSLGCQIAPTGGAVGAGGSTPIVQAPALTTQTEQ